MKLGLVVNNIFTEKAGYTTTLIASTAVNMGHEVWYIAIEQLSYDVTDCVYAKAIKMPEHKCTSRVAFLKMLTSENLVAQRVTLDELDILWLRNDPAEDVFTRPWAAHAGINFGRLAMRHGVLVINDPVGLSEAVNKTYLQYFPEEVRPRAIITRDGDDIKHFIAQEGGYAVLKPLSGSGGHNVFIIQPGTSVNTNQIIEAICQEGYVIAQEYLHDAQHGDTRLFMINGKPLCYKNKIAAIHRARQIGDVDMRSNMRTGALAKKAQVTPEMMEVAEIVRPKLTLDGLFFVGLDIVGNKLMEINVFSPGGLKSSEEFEKAKFSQEIVYALEKKVGYIRHYNRHFDNAEMAML
ncbi:hypothetical protein AAD001_01085 [Colwelliaceae bacterium 6471]